MKKDAQTLLIVDDDYFQQELLKNWLTKENYNVIVASNGRQALEIVKQHKPDLILLDLVMPELDGFETANYLKENPDTKKIPVVIITSEEERDKRIRVLDIGVDDFLNKPIDKIELLVRVRNLLQSRAYFQQLQERQAHLFQLENLASIGTLINSVTRELSTPLDGLKTVIYEAQKTQPEHIGTILDEASEHIEHIDLVVHNLGLYIESISTSSDSTSDISVVLEQVLELLNYQMEAEGIKIQTHIKPNLPTVLCSNEGLMHVLVHLLLNAKEALQDTQNPCIDITIDLAGEHTLLISVNDNNTETTEDIALTITDPLFSAKLPQVCASLGLALACHFIEGSGGSISVNGAAGRGCSMNVMLKTA